MLMSSFYLSSIKPFASTSASPRQRFTSNNGAAANSDSFHSVVASTNQIKGFEVTDEESPNVSLGLKELNIDKELEMGDEYAILRTEGDGDNLGICDSFVYDKAGPRVVMETNESLGMASGGSGHERDTWGEEATSSNKDSPEDDILSPWKAQKKKEKALDSSGNSDVVMSRPRANALRESDNYNDVTSLLQSFEQHTELHREHEEKPLTSNPFDLPVNPPPITQPQTDGITSRHKDFVFPINDLETSTSVPSESKIHTYLESGLGSGNVTSISTEAPGHNRSKSVDCHPRVSHNVTPPSARKKYFDPYANDNDNHTHSSLGSLKEGESVMNDQLMYGSRNSSSSHSRNSSGKSSLLSLDGRGSPHSKIDGRGSPHRKSDGRDSPRKKFDIDLASRGYSSGEARRPSSSKQGSHDKGYSSGERFNSSRGYTSSECTSRRRVTTGSSIPRVHSHSDIYGSPRSSRRQAVGKNIKEGRNRWDFLSGSPKKGGNSSEEKQRRQSLTLYKDEDPTYIDSNLNLYLDIEVFNLEKREQFKLVFRSPVVQYDHSKEMPSLVVISNLCVYIFRITAPEK